MWDPNFFFFCFCACVLLTKKFLRKFINKVNHLKKLKKKLFVRKLTKFLTNFTIFHKSFVKLMIILFQLQKVKWCHAMQLIKSVKVLK